MRSVSLRERYIAPVTALSLALALGGAACGKSKPTCISPFRVSQEFPGDPNAVENDQNTWHEGVEADTVLPKIVEELRVGFTDPGGNWHDSKWIARKEAGDIALRIGRIDVRFRTQVKVPKGSALCEEKPDTT